MDSVGRTLRRTPLIIINEKALESPENRDVARKSKMRLGEWILRLEN
jgi:hypothetical protein